MRIGDAYRFVVLVFVVFRWLCLYSVCHAVAHQGQAEALRL
jgi:hypothetical protein